MPSKRRLAASFASLAVWTPRRRFGPSQPFRIRRSGLQLRPARGAVINRWVKPAARARGMGLTFRSSFLGQSI